MKKLLLGIFILNHGFVFAQTQNLNDWIDKMDKTLSGFSQKEVGQKGMVGAFIRTKDNKFIRIQSKFLEGRGVELNKNLSDALLSKGFYEGKNVEIPELGVKCEFVKFQYDPKRNLGISYGKCEKK